MTEFPKSEGLLGRIVTRLHAARVGRVSYWTCLALAGVVAVLLLVSRLTGLIPDWFSLPAILMLPLIAVLGTAIVLRRPTLSDAARRVDTYAGTQDLFLTLTMIDNAAGDYKPLVGRDAEAKAPSVEPMSVVPWHWARGASQLAAALGLLMLGSLFLPTLDPFGKVAAAKEAELQQEELVQARKETELRKSALTKADLDAETSEEIERSLEDLKTSLREMQPKQQAENARVIAGHQKAIGEQWRERAEQLKQLLSQKPMEQRFGDQSQSKPRQWAKNLREGDADELKDELDKLQKEMSELADMQDPVERTEAMRRLQKKLEDLHQFAKEDVNSKPLAAALERAMKELEAGKGERLSEEQMEALSEAMELAEMELKQIAQSARDLAELEKALEAMQMAKRLNNDEKLDGEEMAELAKGESMEAYMEMYAEMMAELGYDIAMLDENGMPGDGEGRGQGEIEAMEHDDSVETDFEDETSKSAIKKGKILLSLKTKGVTERDEDEIELEYSAIVSDLKQSVSEAIDQEQIPPGYHDGIKKYFDSLDKTGTNGSK
ncbi:MAG: hypothetical protein R3C02_03500 [Planctomycetaceae bacterium]